MAQQPSAPTPRQLAYLRRLAEATGTSFATPRSRAQASREIDRLKRRPRTSAVERRIERRAVSDALACPNDAAAVRDDEVIGYGSSARWAGRETDR